MFEATMLFVPLGLAALVLLALSAVNIALVAQIVTRTRRAAWLLAALPAAVLGPIGALLGGAAMVIGLFIAANVLHHPYEATGADAAPVFYTEFGCWPGADVKDLRSSVDSMFDSGGAYLRFEASSDTVDRILGLGFQPARCDAMDVALHAGNRPEWWAPPAGTGRRCYDRDRRLPGANHRSVIAITPGSATAYYHNSVIW